MSTMYVHNVYREQNKTSDHKVIHVNSLTSVVTVQCGCVVMDFDLTV